MNAFDTTLRNARTLAVAALLLAGAGAAVAQAPPDRVLESGVTEIELPADGILRYGSLTLQPGADLRFIRNAANTPVQILATGPILIDNDAIIRVDATAPSGANPGIGGPGGFDGGNAGAFPAGNGLGPGGGQGGCPTYRCDYPDKVGHGAFGCDGDGSVSSGVPYGNPVLLSLIGGSGGGGNDDGYGGGGGGGAILLSSDVRITMRGTISATGTCGNYLGCGSGGAIRLRAPIVAGTGALNVGGSAGNHGRIRIDALDRSGVLFGYNPPCAMTSGSIMAVSAINGTLRITEVGGQPISPDASGQVFVNLSASAPRTVKVRVNGFGGVVPVEVALTPDLGDRITQVVEADMGTADGDGNVVVTATFANFPANMGTRVDAWTR